MPTPNHGRQQLHLAFSHHPVSKAIQKKTARTDPPNTYGTPKNERAVGASGLRDTLAGKMERRPPRTLYRAAICTLAAVASTPPHAQGQGPVMKRLPHLRFETAPLDSFGELPTLQQVRIVLAARRKLRSLPTVQRIVKLADGVDRESISSFEGLPVHDPAKWCPGAEIVRTPSSPESAAYRAARSAFPQQGPLGTLHKTWGYDWGRSKIVRYRKETWVDAFENLWNGWPPDVDLAIAAVCARLDAEAGSEVRRLGHWFEHAYCDREGRIYPDITLYEAWASGRQVEVPDVDSVAFAHLVLGDRSVRTPVVGATRTRVYEAIRAGASAWRRHKTTVLAASLAIATSRAPGLASTNAERSTASGQTPDEVIDSLLPRFHWLWIHTGGDLEQIAKKTVGRDRRALIRSLDDAVLADSAEMAKRDRAGRELQILRRAVHDAVREAFEDATRGQ